MANPEHLDILRQGVAAWNRWRDQHQDISPDLIEADLGEANLIRADLTGAVLISAHLGETNLSAADLRGANLRSANLGRANLGGAVLRDANLRGANLYDAGLIK